MRNPNRDVIEKLLDSARTNIDAALLLLDHQKDDEQTLNALSNLWFAIEKLIRANLFACHPLLLKKAPTPKDILDATQSPERFDSKYILGLRDKAVSVSVAWKLLCEAAPTLERLSKYFDEGSKIRNQQTHSFCPRPAPLALTKGKKDAWVIIEKLCVTLKSVADKKETLQDLDCSSKRLVSDSAALQEFKKFNLRHDFQLVQDANKELIAQGKDFHELVRHSEIDPAEHYFTIDCPICEKSEGHVGIALEGSYRIDNEGDEAWWEGPVQYDAYFEHYVCSSCGTCVSSLSVLSDLEYDVDSLTPHLYIDWDINEGITNVAAEPYLDKVSCEEVSDVCWNV